MDSKAFHICPFCQSSSPVSDVRCARCHRSLAGLPLPVYGSEVDDALSGREPQPLVDLPLREEASVAAAPPPAPAPKAAALMPAEAGRSRPRANRHRMGRGVKIGIASGIMGTALVGGWLVRAQDRPRPEAPMASSAAPASADSPAAMAAPSSMTVPPAIAPAPRIAVATPRAPEARSTSAPAPRSAPAPESTNVSARAAARRASRRARPAAEPMEDYPVPPDVEADPVGVVRARDEMPRDRSLEDEPHGDDRRAGARAGLLERLRRAERRRDAVAERVDRLRERANVPVIKDVEAYQRVQADLAVALDDLEAADAEVARHRRALDEGGR
jgi:hypothetical protein